MKRTAKFLAPLMLFLIAVGFLFKGLFLDPHEVPSPLVGKPAPEFTAPLLSEPEKRFNTVDMKGKVWLLNVWASWCVACREEHPLLVEFSRRKTVPVYGLNYKDARADGLRWLAKFGDPYDASLFDNDGKVGIDFGVYGVPETFIIDKLGVIRFKHIGPVTPAVLKDRIEPLLKALSA